MAAWLTDSRVLACMALIGLALSALAVTANLVARRAPLVDLSVRRQPAEMPAAPAQSADELRFAVATMVSVEATFETYERLVKKVSHSVGRRAAFVLHSSYADVRLALEREQVDVAFVCTGTYVYSRPGERVKLLVQPEFENGLEYRSLLIVPAPSPAEKLEDLRGTVMAFTDPESNTGYLVPSVTLAERGWEADSFFRKIVFTGSHDRSIRAVALGLVDGAAVDALVWESAKRQDSSLAKRVKVIWASETYGPPPIVVPVGLDQALEASLREAFLTLDGDEEGREILSIIGIKRFVPAREEAYRTAVELYRKIHAEGAAQ